MTGIAVLVGILKRPAGRYNAASVLENGRRVATYHKQLLPNYEVFDEERYFDPGSTSCVFTIRACAVASISAPISGRPVPPKAPMPPVQNCCSCSTPLRTTSTSSRTGPPCCVGALPRPAFRRSMRTSSADRMNWSSMARRSPSTRPVARWCACRSLRSPLGFVDVVQGEPQPGALAVPQALEAQVYAALVLGVRDYIGKNDFPGVLIGLSGGIDSALTLAIAVDALGADKVRAVMMPSPYTADISLADSRQMVQTLGVRYDEIAIAPAMAVCEEMLANEFAGLASDTTEENLQARIRGNLLMALSNKTGALVLTTGNKSEMAVGYCTLYGDMAGGFAVIRMSSRPSSPPVALGQSRTRDHS